MGYDEFCRLENGWGTPRYPSEMVDLLYRIFTSDLGFREDVEHAFLNIVDGEKRIIRQPIVDLDHFSHVNPEYQERFDRYCERYSKDTQFRIQIIS